MDCTFDELTGSGSVATADSIADRRMATVSGEKDALAKSFTALFLAHASGANRRPKLRTQRRNMYVVPSPSGRFLQQAETPDRSSRAKYEIPGSGNQRCCRGIVE
jgi:hypothetical protein